MDDITKGAIWKSCLSDCERYEELAEAVRSLVAVLEEALTNDGYTLVPPGEGGDVGMSEELAGWLNRVSISLVVVRGLVRGEMPGQWA